MENVIYLVGAYYVYRAKLYAPGFSESMYIIIRSV